jgi:hypothetical protein
VKRVSWLGLVLVGPVFLSAAIAAPLSSKLTSKKVSSAPAVAQTSPRPLAATPPSPAQDMQAIGEVQVLNQSGTPIQVILTRKDGATQESYWNFSSRQGKDMRLKVDEKPLLLSAGDVIAAIAMDGSRNFWGPFVTGRPNIPLTWDIKKKMWTLTINRGLEPIAAGTVPAPSSKSSPVPATPTGRKGSLRIGNTTDLKVRIVLTKRDGSVSGAFWDYEPQEGGAEGVELALGETPLIVQEGDILMAFSPEFPDRFWGPDIVGATPAPFWDNKRRVWSALLKP